MCIKSTEFFTNLVQLLNSVTSKGRRADDGRATVGYWSHLYDARSAAAAASVVVVVVVRQIEWPFHFRPNKNSLFPCHRQRQYNIIIIIVRLFLYFARFRSVFTSIPADTSLCTEKKKPIRLFCISIEIFFSQLYRFRN